MIKKKKIIYTSFSQDKDNSYFLIGTKEECLIYQEETLGSGLNLSKSNKIIISYFL